MKKIAFLLLSLILFYLGCATPPVPPAARDMQIFNLKELQTGLLIEADRQRQKNLADQYLELAEKMPQGVVLANMFGDILEANPAYQKMLGYTLAELKNITFQKITPSKWHEKEKQKINEAMAQDYVHFQKEYIRKDDTILSVEVTCWIIKDRKENPIGIGSMIRQ